MYDFTRIASRDNEKIKLYRRLAADKRARKKEGLFVIEGARLVSDAAAEAIELHCIFVTDAAASRYSEALELLLKKYPRKIFHSISDDLAAALSDTQMPQGLFAVCGIPEADKEKVYDSIKRGGRYLILDGIQDPGNMGTMLRTADACGIDAVFTVNCCDIYNPKVVRSAMGSLMRVSIADDRIESAVDVLRAANIPVYAAVIGEGLSLAECTFDGGGAVIIGNEGSGIPEEHISLADHRLTIKMHGTVNSLNAAMAAGIIMWELSK